MTRSDIETAISALEAQRALLGDAVVDLALAPLRERLNALETTSEGNEALRIVSVLFLDVVESTAMSRGLDPEDVRAMFHGALRRFSEVVEKFEGRVLRYAGDGMLALFGATGVREDDAERAVLCGLALIEEARALAPRFQSEHGVVGFNVRVGISTGPVLLSRGVDRGYDVSGMSVNVAARMEQTAPPGKLRISHHTFVHVRGLFDAIEQPPIAVKGLVKPILTYVVGNAKRRDFQATTAGVESFTQPLVGRERELGRLIEAFEDVASRHRMKVLMLSGEAGMGKSRLLDAFGEWVANQAQKNERMHARSPTYGTGVPYGLVRDLFFRRFGIADSDTLPAASKKLSDGLTPFFGARAGEQIALIGQLAGLDFSASPHIAGILGDPRQLRNRAFHAASEFLRIVADRTTTVVLLFDDVHWADEGSLDFIRHLSATCDRVAILCVCGARPELFTPDVTSQLQASGYERVDMAALPSKASLELADALLQRIDEPPEGLRKLLIEGAEGNPFYMEEIVKMLIDEQVIVTTQTPWRVAPDRLVGFHVPATLAGVLQARVDALSENERACLQVASVVGAVCWDEAIAQIDRAHVDALPPLVDRHLLLRHEHTAFSGVGEFAFHHHLLHRVTYDTVLKRNKRRHHRQIAEWLVSRTADRAGEFSGLIAHHFERAGDAARSVEYLIRAAEHAQNRHQREIAITHLARALEYTAEEDLAGRFELVSRRASVLGGTDRPLEREADVALLEQIAERLDDDKYRARAAEARASFAVVAGDFVGAARAAERVISLSDLVPPSTVCFARIYWARAVQYLGDYAGAQTHIEACLRVARETNEQRAERVATCQLGLIEAELGRFSNARRHFDEALKTSRDSGDKTMEGILINNLASVEQMLGNYPRARELLEAGRRLSQDVGDVLTGAYALCNLSAVVKEQGDAHQSLELATESVDMARRVNAPDLEARALVVLGNAQAAIGRLDDANASYDASLALFRHIGRPTMQLLPMSALAETARKRGDADAAMQYVDKIVEHVDAGGELDGLELSSIYFECFKSMAATGNPRADAFLRLAYDEVARQAQHLEPAERTTFLGNVATNAAIVEEATRIL